MTTCTKPFLHNSENRNTIETMEKIRLSYSHNESVAHIVLDDGKGNVLDAIMMQELTDLLNSFRDNKNIKLITFSGARGNFSYGASVAEHTRDLAGDMIHSFHNLFLTMVDLSIPTMSMISGKCLGGGMELAIFCNLIMADKTAMLGQPEIMLGVIAPPASLMLPLKIGNARAEELLITGRTFKAKQGKKMGLINDVFDNKEEMQTAVNNWIELHIISKSASSLRYAIKCARTVFNETLISKLPILENIYLNQLMETKDANEGILAFMEKRKPAWENC